MQGVTGETCILHFPFRGYFSHAKSADPPRRRCKRGRVGFGSFSSCGLAMLATRAARTCAGRVRPASLQSAPIRVVASRVVRTQRSAAACVPSVPRRFVSGQLPRAPKVENEEDIPFGALLMQAC